MYKILLVGDLHSKNSNLEETKKIFEFINIQCLKYNIKSVFLLGDLFDTHGIVHLPVVYMYHDLFNKYKNLNFYCLVGNHDYVVHGSHAEHALVSFKFLSNVQVIDAADGQVYTYKQDNIQFDCIPHTTQEQFFTLCKQKKSDILLCHHTFTGAQYENNFFAPDGIDLEKTSYKRIVSGHIHKIQEVGKAFYVGAPRWLKESDANQDKGIWAWDGQDKFDFISVDSVCCKINVLNIDENSNLDIPINDQHRYIFNVKGDRDFVESIALKFKTKVEVRQIPDEYKKVKVKESDGVLQSLHDFVKYKYKTIYNIDNEQLWETISYRLKI